MSKNSLTDRNYTRQSHTIVNARMSLTKLEIDIILVLMTSIEIEDKDFKDYQFSIKELEHKLGHKLQSKQLKKNIKSIMSKPIELPPTQIKGEWEIVNWFSYFKYSPTGVITCRFDKMLKPFLLELKKRFVVSDLRMLLPMKSSYSKRIYLLLKEYSKIGHRVFDVEELQELLKVPKGMKRYDNFKRQILKRAETDINKFTDLEVKLSEKKRARKVIEITYSIKKNHTDLKTFIKIIKEIYTNTILYFSKDNRPIMCNTKGFLYYSDDKENSYIDEKEAKKLWEYLHENRENLYVFKKNLEESKKYLYLSSMSAFQTYLKDNFAYKKIVELTKKDDNEIVNISIFPNGRLFDMSGELLSDDNIVKIWKILYKLANEGKLKIFSEE